MGMLSDKMSGGDGFGNSRNNEGPNTAKQEILTEVNNLKATVRTSQIELFKVTSRILALEKKLKGEG